MPDPSWVDWGNVNKLSCSRKTGHNQALNLQPFGCQADTLATWVCCPTCTHTTTCTVQCCYGDVSTCRTLFTATEILSDIISTFTEVNGKVLQPLLSEAVVGADDLAIDIMRLSKQGVHYTELF